MSQIVNNNKLNLIITEYGLERIAEAVQNPGLNLEISKIRLGDGQNKEYYEPSPTQTSLKGDLGLDFYIYDKELLEDGCTISFHTIIPETSGNYDIREIGLYEHVNNEYKLFAICTQQPFVKPSPDDFYFINIDYYMFLKCVNFAEIYEQIVLDPEHTVVTDKQLEDLMRTFLFAHGNVINQIGNNSRIIGYNRATQLYEKIVNDKKSFSYTTLFKNLTFLTNMLKSEDNLFSYWAFDYSEKKNTENSVMDLSNHGYYLATNKSLTSYPRDYDGFVSMISFNPPNYFSLSSQIPLNLYDKDKNKDIPFSMIFVLEPLETNIARTLIAKSNYATGTHSFEITETADRSLRVRLFSDSENYLTFTSLPASIPSGYHSIILSYDPETEKITAYINAIKQELLKEETGEYTHINESPGTLYAFSCTPSFSVFTNNSEIPEELYNNDGSPYAGDKFTISGYDIYYEDKKATYTPSENTVTSRMYAWTPSGTTVYDHVIYSKTPTISVDTVLYTSDYRVNDPLETLFTIAPSGSNYVILYNGNQTERNSLLDIEPKTIYCFKYSMPEETIWTNSTTAPTVLYNSDDSYYTGSEWTIEGNEIYYIGNIAYYDSTKNRETFNPDITSYIINSYGETEEYINAKVGLISIIKEKLSNENARLMSLLLCASLGKNPFLGGNL